MSQRDSGYERKERDLYETPGWVTEALLPHIEELSINGLIWEPAAGSGQMAGVLERAYLGVVKSDIDTGTDFLAVPVAVDERGLIDKIITNPPYDLATEFCEHALRLMEPVNGLVAMLLRTDFDHAKSRTHLFRDCPAFSKKLVLMKRICWFVEANGKPKASPSFNHAWYIWDWKHNGPPTIGYGP
jgi:hypothetical protein